MARVSLIGPGDVAWHYERLLGIHNTEFNEHIEGLAEVLARNGHELSLLPDKGAPYELAKAYRRQSDGIIVANVPASDTNIGIEHLQRYREAEIKGKPVFNKEIDTGTWYKQDVTHTLFADAVLLLGSSLGSLGELNLGYYVYNLLGGHKTKVQARKKRVNKEILAGREFTFTTLCYTPFMKDKLPVEIEAYIRKSGGQVQYIDNANELEKALKELK